MLLFKCILPELPLRTPSTSSTARDRFKALASHSSSLSAASNEKSVVRVALSNTLRTDAPSSHCPKEGVLPREDMGSLAAETEATSLEPGSREMVFGGAVAASRS